LIRARAESCAANNATLIRVGKKKSDPGTLVANDDVPSPVHEWVKPRVFMKGNVKLAAARRSPSVDGLSAAAHIAEPVHDLASRLVR
jgi:hypothetical protein